MTQQRNWLRIAYMVFAVYWAGCAIAELAASLDWWGGFNPPSHFAMAIMSLGLMQWMLTERSRVGDGGHVATRMLTDIANSRPNINWSATIDGVEYRGATAVAAAFSCAATTMRLSGMSRERLVKYIDDICGLVEKRDAEAAQ